jgi:transposase-like protein
MFDAGCGPELYWQQGKAFDFPDLTATPCPQCKKAHLKRHGFYVRYLVTIGFDGEILIRRHRCPECGRTVSLLPSFCHPMRTYGICAIIGILKEYYAKMRAACLAAAVFLKETGVEYTRQLLRHYRRRIERNLNSLAMAVTDIFGLRDPPVTSAASAREKVRQLLSHIRSPLDCSLEIFKRTRATYLTNQAR